MSDHPFPPPIEYFKNRRHLWSRSTLLAFLVCLSLLTNVLGNWPIPAVFAATISPAHPKPGALTFQHYLQQGRHNKTASGPFIPPTKIPLAPGTQHDKPGPTVPSAEPPTMKPLTATLSSSFLSATPGTKPLDLTSSDGRLEVQLAPGAFDLSHASIASGKKSSTTPKTRHTSQPHASSGTPGEHALTGPLTLTITEQHGYFVGEQVILGQYQFALTDGQGHAVSGVVVRTPITMRYHYREPVMTQFDIDPGHLFLTWPTAIMAAAKLHHIATGAMLPLHNDPKTHTLTTPITSIGPGPFTFTGDPSNESPPVPHLAGVQGNSGQLSYSYPIDTAPGPDGFGPALQLAYASEAVNERHSFNQPAGAMGDGWAFSLGAISADVHGASSAGGSLTWYNLSGVDGISDRLVPTANHNVYVTQHLTYLKIDFDTTNNCFHVWDMSGTYYEFGCVPSALRYHKDTDGTIHYYQWDLDKVIAPNEGNASAYKSMTISYLQDCQPVSTPCPTASNAADGTAIRDASVKQITVSAGNTIVATTDLFYQGPNTVTDNGVTWETQYSSSYYTNCKPPKTTSLRCDDPIDYAGGLLAPTVMSTLSLQQITSYVGPDPHGGSGGSLAYQYNFAYQDSPFSAFGWNGAQCADPTQPSSPSVYEYCAGEHLLSSITESISNSGSWHALKPVLFDYAQHTNSYADFNQKIPGTQTIYQVHVTWQYLADYVDTNTGVGGHIVYMTGYGNTHGTPNIYNGNGVLIDDRHDPTFCFQHATCTGSYAGPDDGQWTGQLVTRITTLGSDSSALGAATTTYYYHLADIPNLNTCPAAGSGSTLETDCPTKTWRPSSDGDWQDYYDGEFFGFQGVFTLSPANNLTESLYYSTEGLNTPYSNYGNYTNGQPYEEDVYASSGTYDPLLAQTTTDYAGNPNDSNPPPPNACDGSFSGVYPPCEAMPTSTITAQCEGVSGCSTNAGTVTWPQKTTTYTYDDYDTTQGLKYVTGNYHNLLSEQTSSNNAPTVTSTWIYKPDDQTIGSTVYYDVDKVVHSEVEDSSSTDWRCQDIIYDEGNTSGVASGIPVAGWPTTVTSYSNCADTKHSAITTYTGYDAYGNVVATVDGNATSNSTLYGSSGTAPDNGCTLSTTPVIMSSNWGKTNYTTCTAYDQYSAQPTTVSNAFGYTNTFTYDYTQGGLPISVTDYNKKATTTAYSFDSNSSTNDKRITDISEPGECQQPGCYTTQSNSYSSCATTMPTGTTTPCFEENENTSEYSSEVSSTFYDSLGRVVESSTPAPPPANPQSGMSYFTVILRAYNDQQNTAWQSVPFVVAVATNQNGSTGAPWLDPATAKDYNSVAPAGTTTYLDALERPIAMKDPLFGQSGVPGIACSATLSGNYTSCTNDSVGVIGGGTKDNNDYAIIAAVDPNAHVSKSFDDTRGRTIYTRAFSGLYGGTLTASEQTTTQYTILGEPTQVQKTDLTPQTGQSITSVTATATYDDLGRVTQTGDPDSGSHTYTYDANGQVLTDISGTRTLGYNYDLLGRLGCLQDATPTVNATGACTSGTNPYEQDTYDISAPGAQWGSTDYPIGQLTQSIATTYYNGSAATSTENTQYDQRGQAITQQLKFSLPSAWNVTTALPTYQLASSYDDANQLTTVATSTVTANGNATPGYTMTQVYDQTSGMLVGLGTINAQKNVNLASVLYNENALVSSINFATNTGNATVASEQFSYDGDLRPIETNATWQSGSGTSGTILDQQRSYDPASNVISLATTLAGVPGKSGSGGSETENFCYDAQNRLVWAGNSGTQPSPGNGTCGSGTLSSNLSGAAYNNSYVYTHLGQLWQGPLNGGNTQYQYLYCNNNAPHQLTGMYPLGTTCSNVSGAVYKTSYDSWGNATSRTYNGTTTTQTFDLLDQLVTWASGTTQKQWYAYNTSGERTLLRSTNGSATTMTVYAFGAEEYSYDGSGNLQSSTHYYDMGGRLIGELTGGGTPSTNLFLTDALGSVLTTFSNVQNSAAVQGNQVYGPYGTQQYNKGSMGTNKGYTGQYADPLSGFDYYNARYYDPVAGVFLSADTVQGNMQGMNPYAYVDGNPETRNDPTGNYYSSDGGISQHGGSIGYVMPGDNVFTTVTNDGGGNYWTLDGQFHHIYGSLSVNTFSRTQENKYGSYNPNTDPNTTPLAKLAHVTGWDALQQTWSNPNATWQDRAKAVGQFALTNLNNALQLAMIVGGPEEEGAGAALEEGGNIIVHAVEGGGEAAASDTVTLYRAVGQNELNDVLHYGDYNLSPHGGGKYFSFTEEGAQQFANSSFNAGRNMTVTSIDVSRSTLESMTETGDAYRFFDSGGGNESIHIANDALPDFYEAMGLPQILDAPWVLAL